MDFYYFGIDFSKFGMYLTHIYRFGAIFDGFKTFPCVFTFGLVPGPKSTFHVLVFKGLTHSQRQTLLFSLGYAYVEF